MGISGAQTTTACGIDNTCGCGSGSGMLTTDGIILWISVVLILIVLTAALSSIFTEKALKRRSGSKKGIKTYKKGK